jgi:hypothetical protein
LEISHLYSILSNIKWWRVWWWQITRFAQIIAGIVDYLSADWHEMRMMFEVQEVRQPPGEGRRRWFTSLAMDLFVWYGEEDEPVGFQLSYDKGTNERSLSWRRSSGYRHHAVDDGEATPSARYKETPLLKSDGIPDTARLTNLLMDLGAALPQDIAHFVIARVREYLEKEGGCHACTATSGDTGADADLAPPS